MPIHRLLSYLDTFHPASEELKSYLMSNVIAVSFPVNHVLLDVPRVASHLFYLVDGFATSYTINRDGKTTEEFWKPGQIVASFESFYYQVPSVEVIQLLTASDLLCMSYEKVTEMFDRYPESNRICRLMISEQYVNARRRIRLLKTTDHYTQYQMLREHYPGIERITTQKSIATYLGVTPQTLARIKRSHRQSR